jgi:hypothetical protein
VIVAVGFALIVTLVEFDALQPAALVTVKPSITVPDAPACVGDRLNVGRARDRPVGDSTRRKSSHRLGPLAMFPVELAQTCAGLGVMVGVEGDA